MAQPSRFLTLLGSVPLLFAPVAVAAPSDPTIQLEDALRSEILGMSEGSRPFVRDEVGGPRVVFPDPLAALAFGARVCDALRPVKGGAVRDLAAALFLPDEHGDQRPIPVRVVIGADASEGPPGAPDGRDARALSVRDDRPRVVLIACGGRGGDSHLAGHGGRGGDVSVIAPGHGTAVLILPGAGGSGGPAEVGAERQELRAGGRGGDGGNGLFDPAGAPHHNASCTGGRGGKGGRGADAGKSDAKGGVEGRPGRGPGSEAGAEGGGGAASDADNGGDGGDGGAGGSCVLEEDCGGQRLAAAGGRGGDGGDGGYGARRGGNGGWGGSGGPGGSARATCRAVLNKVCEATASGGEGGKGGNGGSGFGVSGLAGEAGKGGKGGGAEAQGCCCSTAKARGGTGGDGGDGGSGCTTKDIATGAANGGAGGDGGGAVAGLFRGTADSLARADGGDAGDGGDGGGANRPACAAGSFGGVGGPPGFPGLGRAANFCPGGKVEEHDGVEGRSGRSGPDKK